MGTNRQFRGKGWSGALIALVLCVGTGSVAAEQVATALPGSRLTADGGPAGQPPALGREVSAAQAEAPHVNGSGWAWSSGAVGTGLTVVALLLLLARRRPIR